MAYTSNTFKQLFEANRNKASLMSFVKKNPDCFVPLLEFSLSPSPDAWRAVWLIGHAMKSNDARVIPFIDNLIISLPLLRQGHQRQTIIVLSKMELNDSQEGKLFDVCLTIWENIKLIPSTRITAIRFILKTTDKFPELKKEVNLWTQEMYLESLSPGIKVRFLREIKKIQ